MQVDKESTQKLPEVKSPPSNIKDIIASMRQVLVLPEDAEAALKLIQGPRRHKAIYVHSRTVKNKTF